MQTQTAALQSHHQVCPFGYSIWMQIFSVLGRCCWFCPRSSRTNCMDIKIKSFFKNKITLKNLNLPTKQIEDLIKAKKQLKEQKQLLKHEVKKEQELIFIFALTKSNQYIHNVDMQNVLKRAFWAYAQKQRL